MKKHLNIFLLSLLGGSMFGQQVSSTVVQNWLKQAQAPIKLDISSLKGDKKLSTIQSRSNLTYCTPEEISTPEEITNVSIKSLKNTLLSNTSANNTAKGYEDFTTVKPADLGQTSEYTFSFQGDTKGAYYSSYTILIDYNQDGIFGSVSSDDFFNSREIIKVDELLFNSTGVDSKVVSHKVIIPQDAVLGNTRMRIMKRQTDRASALHPKNGCDLGSTYGQVEDYMVNIIPPVVCTTTTNGAAIVGTFIPTNNKQEVIAKGAKLGTYIDVFVYTGNSYTFESSNKNVYLSLKDVAKNVNLASTQTAISWISDRTGVIRLYLHSDENCSVSTEKTDISMFSFNNSKNPINEPCNIGIATVDFQLIKELNGINNQEIALDLNAYSGRGTKISGIKLNLQGDATKVDFELIDDVNGLPSTSSTMIRGKILSKNLIGTINGKSSYEYDIDFDKVIDLNALEIDGNIKKWLKIVTDAQTLEVNTNFAIGLNIAIKNTKDNQGKWILDKNSEAVYQLKAECQYNSCKQAIPETPKIEGLSFPAIEGSASLETIIDIVAEKGKKLEISGLEVEGWYMGLAMSGEAPKDVLPTLDLKLLENNPVTGLPYNQLDKKGVTAIGIASLDTINLQTILLSDDTMSILLIKKKLKVKFNQSILVDGDKIDKYWLSLKAENISSWDVNPNVDVTIGEFPYILLLGGIAGIDDMWSPYKSEIVYRLNSTCSTLGTGEVNTINKLKIYPNPFNNQITVESVNVIKNVEIFNMAGLKVNSTSINSKKSTITVSNLPSGVYILRSVDDKGNIETQKLIKK